MDESKSKSRRYAVVLKTDVELAGICTGAVRFVEAQEQVGLTPITSVNHLALVVADRLRGAGAMYAA